MKLYTNAKFYSMDDKSSQYKSVLIANERIVKCYVENPKINPNWEVIDLKNKYVLPGFIDTHTHSFEGGLYSLSCDLKPCKNINEVLEKLRETTPIGNRVFAFQFDENLIPEKRFPTLAELDKLFPNTPVLLRRIDGHSCVINSLAAKTINWKDRLPNNFNGLLRKEWNDIAAHWFHRSVQPEGILKAYKAAQKIAMKNGQTTLHTMIGDADQDPLHYKLLHENLSDYEIGWILYPQIFDIEKALELGAKRIGGCILADGSFGSHTAAISSPYTDNTSTKGAKYQTDEFWIDFVKKAHAYDLQVGVHAIGDVAISQLINAYKKAQIDNPKDLRHQVIHCELVNDQMISDMAKYNITAAMQPMFDRLWGGTGNFYEEVLGSERILKMNRFKSMTDNGVIIGGGSDWYITDVDPKQGIDAAERSHNPIEAVDRKTAIEFYTKRASYLSHDESNIGTIENGKLADFVIMNNDPFKISNFLSSEIDTVIKKGKLINLDQL